MLLESIIESLNSSGFLHEALTAEQYKKYFENTKFGIEIECILDPDSKMYRALSLIAQNYTSANVLHFSSLIHTMDYKVPKAISIIEKTFRKDQEQFVNYMQTIKSQTGKDYTRAFKNLFKLLDTGDQPVYISGYHEGNSAQGWRIESDGSLGTYGMEVISPNNNGDNLSYYNALKIVPDVISALKELEFKGSKKTGMHLNISHNGDLSRRAFTNLLDSLKAKGYSEFSIMCYLTGQEAEPLWRMGEYGRQAKTYSKDFRNYFKVFCNSSNGVGDFLIKKILTEIVKNLPKQLDDKDAFNFVVKIPMKPLIDGTKKFPKGFQWISDFTEKLINREYRSESHHIDISMRSNRVELRGFGGAGAFDISKNPDSLGKALRAGITQLLPFLDQTSINKKDIMRSTFVVLRDILAVKLDEVMSKVEGLPQHMNLDTNELVKFFDLVSNIKLVYVGVEVDYTIDDISVVYSRRPIEAFKLKDTLLNGGSGILNSQAKIFNYDSVPSKLNPKLPNDIVINEPVSITLQQDPDPRVPVEPTTITHDNSNDDVIVLGTARPISFYYRDMYSPNIKHMTDNSVVVFGYGSPEENRRYKIRFSNRVVAQRLFDLIINRTGASRTRGAVGSRSQQQTTGARVRYTEIT